MNENWDEFLNFVKENGLSRDDAYKAINLYQLQMALARNLGRIKALKYDVREHQIEFDFERNLENGNTSKAE